MLINDEGLKLKPYKCPAGKWTIGIGRNLEDKGITAEEAVFLLKNDLRECQGDLSGVVFIRVLERVPRKGQVCFFEYAVPA